VRYVTGFESSNSAVLVDGDRVLLVTDGRYAEAARTVEEIDEVVEADRNLLAWLGDRLAGLAEGPVAFESDHVTVAG
jgi:Creatinase/Prolidase N-terminal domain